jgi:septal ring factor EnvC (AmiA/AmiB activator)
MNLTPDPAQIIAHLRNQIAEKSEEAATNWSGMQLLNSRVQELEKENAEIKQRLLECEGDEEGVKEDGESLDTAAPKKSVKRKK